MKRVTCDNEGMFKNVQEKNRCIQNIVQRKTGHVHSCNRKTGTWGEL